MNNITKKRLLNLSAIIIINTILTGCGGGGSSASFESNTPVSITMCDNPTTPWTKLSSGDTVSASKDSQLKFDHDSNSNKQVCVVSGNAYFLNK